MQIGLFDLTGKSLSYTVASIFGKICNDCGAQWADVRPLDDGDVTGSYLPKRAEGLLIRPYRSLSGAHYMAMEESAHFLHSFLPTASQGMPRHALLGKMRAAEKQAGLCWTKDSEDWEYQYARDIWRGTLGSTASPALYLGPVVNSLPQLAAKPGVQMLARFKADGPPRGHERAILAVGQPTEIEFNKGNIGLYFPGECGICWRKRFLLNANIAGSVAWSNTGARFSGYEPGVSKVELPLDDPAFGLIKVEQEGRRPPVAWRRKDVVSVAGYGATISITSWDAPIEIEVGQGCTFILNPSDDEVEAAKKSLQTEVV